MSVTPGVGFTKIGESASGESPGADLLAEWLVNQTAINAIWTTLNGGGLGLEIKAAQ